MKKTITIATIVMLLGITFLPGVSQAASLAERLQGRILLQVESHGEAWYVNPLNQNRYYLGRPFDAFDLMKKLGLGISNRNFDSFRGVAPIRLSGRILLKVEDLGKAYYVNPIDLKLYFLGRPLDAFNLMRSLGLGISNSNLSQIGKAADSKPVPGEAAMEDAALELVAQNLNSPLALMSAYDNSGRLFVADQAGLVRIIDANDNLLSEPFLDLRSKMVTLNANYDERGLLGLAFHPNYRNNGRFFVYYSVALRAGAPTGWNHTSRISEFNVSDTNANIADLSSEKIILEIDQPQANHNAGQIAFGLDDNKLYIPLGDGGNANDVGLGHAVGGNAQDIASLLGKILRIDVDSLAPYVVPSDNPFVNAPGQDEIYAYGFRNPFHISFDAGGSHDLIVGDAGQNQWEEVDVVTKGGNYGWNLREGRHCFDANKPDNPPVTCSSQGKTLINPVIEYKNIRQSGGGLGAVVIGGYVYRGTAIPKFQGKYVFGDWSKSFTNGDGTILVAERVGGNWPYRELSFKNMTNGRLGAYLLGFGQDENNELYVLAKTNSGPSGSTGKIYKLIASSSNLGSEREVKIKNFVFAPQIITVNSGTKIKWINEDNMVHTVTSAGNFDSGNIDINGEYELVLTNKGTYNYICTLHPAMTGTIIVQ